MEKIIESKSLRFICNQINFGILDIDNVESVKIISPNKQNFHIKIIEVDLSQYIFDLFEKNKLSKNIKKAETNFYDFIVFGEIPNEEKTGSDLICVPLLELIISGPAAIDENATQAELNMWSLDSEEWSLVIEN